MKKKADKQRYMEEERLKEKGSYTDKDTVLYKKCTYTIYIILHIPYLSNTKYLNERKSYDIQYREK